MVEFGHYPPAGFPGGGEFLVAFFECLAQVEDLLAEAVGLFAESSSIGWGPSPVRSLIWVPSSSDRRCSRLRAWRPCQWSLAAHRFPAAGLMAGMPSMTVCPVARIAVTARWICVRSSSLRVSGSEASVRSERDHFGRVTLARIAGRSHQRDPPRR